MASYETHRSEVVKPELGTGAKGSVSTLQYWVKTREDQTLTKSYEYLFHCHLRWPKLFVARDSSSTLGIEPPIFSTTTTIVLTISIPPCGLTTRMLMQMAAHFGWLKHVQVTYLLVGITMFNHVYDFGMLLGAQISVLIPSWLHLSLCSELQTHVWCLYYVYPLGP